MLVFGFLEPQVFFRCRPVCLAWRGVTKAAWTSLELWDLAASRQLVSACLHSTLLSVDLDEEVGYMLPPDTWSQFSNLKTCRLRLGVVRRWSEEIWTRLAGLEAISVCTTGHVAWWPKFPPRHKIRTCRLERIILFTPSLFLGDCLETLELRDLSPRLLEDMVQCPTLVNLSWRRCDFGPSEILRLMTLSLARKKRWKSLELAPEFPGALGHWLAESGIKLWTEFVVGLETLKINFRPTAQIIGALTSLTNLELESLPVDTERGVWKALPPTLARLRVAFQAHDWAEGIMIGDRLLAMDHGALTELVLRRLEGVSRAVLVDLCTRLPKLQRLTLVDIPDLKYAGTAESLRKSCPRVVVNKN